MCKVMEDMRESVAKEAAERARWQTKVESVLRWVAMGISLDQIAQGEDLTLEQVQNIAGVNNA